MFIYKIELNVFNRDQSPNTKLITSFGKRLYKCQA